MTRRDARRKKNFPMAMAEEAIAEGFDQIGELVDQGDIAMAQEIYTQLEERFPRDLGFVHDAPLLSASRQR